MRKIVKHEHRIWPLVRLNKCQILLRDDYTFNTGPQYHNLLGIFRLWWYIPPEPTVLYLHTFPSLGKLFPRPAR